MADYPDGMQHVNIAAQDIAELTQRPKYGAINYVAYATTIFSMEAPTLFFISGKGMIYGGYLVSSSIAASHNSDYIVISIDGISFTAITFRELDSYILNSNWNEIVHIRKFDDVNWQYSISFSQNITFESQFQLQYFNVQPTSTYVKSTLYYALI